MNISKKKKANNSEKLLTLNFNMIIIILTKTR
nr:MAG TPA: hypothetical protein [Caudoviricetes sp.]